MFEKIGYCPHHICDERLHHAGLSPEGRMCFIGGFDDHVYAVWDIEKEAVVWKEDSYEPTEKSLPGLERWLSQDGCITVTIDSNPYKFHVFGLSCGTPRMVDDRLGIRLNVDLPSTRLQVLSAKDGSEIESHHFKAISGDWAMASLSDNSAIIAVLEPYGVTFFSRLRRET